MGLAGTFALGVYSSRRMNARSFDFRMAAAVVLFFAFGILGSIGLGHFKPRQLGVFWPACG